MKYILILLTCLLFTACSTQKVELPESPQGVDEMRISPCACTHLLDQKVTYTWRG